MPSLSDRHYMHACLNLPTPTCIPIISHMWQTRTSTLCTHFIHYSCSVWQDLHHAQDTRASGSVGVGSGAGDVGEDKSESARSYTNAQRAAVSRNWPAKLASPLCSKKERAAEAARQGTGFMLSYPLALWKVCVVCMFVWRVSLSTVHDLCMY